MGGQVSFGVGIIGCGLVGQKRAKSLGAGRLIACADVNEGRAKALAVKDGARAFGDWKKLLALPEVEIVVVATLHDCLAEITLAAIEAGKHVLVEKPAARNPAELKPVMAAARRRAVKVRVGFNHRYHRAFRKARELFEAGALGELMFIRARYGHGGRIGYEKEWRADVKISGGGELIDQGVHLIDLAGIFLGEFTKVEGHATTYFWKMPVDDNAFLSLRNANGNTAWLHVSCSEWKNLFSLEIYGRDAKLHWEGLGGSYGMERLTYYKMLPQMGPPETTVYEFPNSDESWKIEMAEFFEDIKLKRTPVPGLKEARAALSVVEKIYAQK